MKHLRFFWWNVQDFGHYTRALAGEHRWPALEDAYVEKRTRVISAIDKAVRLHGRPHVVGLAEVTQIAARFIRDELFPTYSIHSMDFKNEPEFQVALLCDSNVKHDQLPPLVVPDMPRGTRPVAAIDCFIGNHQFRFFANHWVARIGDLHHKHREEIARYLAHHIYDFMHPAKSVQYSRHLVFMGDLNDEPYGVPESDLYGGRSHDRARGIEHYADGDVRRHRIYNCCWRMLGEAHPHSNRAFPGALASAGTYYRREKLSWHTFDQVLVSGTLLGSGLPSLDESSIRVVCEQEFLHADGKPDKFFWTPNGSQGLSDHLPVVGRIILK